MADTLLNALLRLEQQAEGRRVDNRQLREAVTRWAEELSDQLRAGDQVEVDGARIAARSVGYYGCQGRPEDGWRLVACPARERVTCLVVESQPTLPDDRHEVLNPPVERKWFDGNNTQKQVAGRLYVVTLDGTYEDARPASYDTLRWVGLRAEQITTAFADLIAAEREITRTATDMARTQRA